MKANKKFLEEEDGERAVSAVIGVILMVAITVAIAATVYVYVSGMMSPNPTAAPNIMGSYDTTGRNIVITLSGESLDADDARLTVTTVNDTVNSKDTPVSSTAYPGWTTAAGTDPIRDYYNITWIDASADGDIGSGDIIKVTGSAHYDHPDDTLAAGTWFIKIIQVSSGKAALDLEIEIKAS